MTDHLALRFERQGMPRPYEFDTGRELVIACWLPALAAFEQVTAISAACCSDDSDAHLGRYCCHLLTQRP